MHALQRADGDNLLDFAIMFAVAVLMTGRRRVQPSRVDIADSYDSKAIVGFKRQGMVHSALSHAHDHNSIFLAHFALPSQARTLAIT
jgi:hypothetical protein